LKALNKVRKFLKNSDFDKYYREKKKVIVSIILLSIILTPFAYWLQKKNNEALIMDGGSLIALDTEGYDGSSITVQAQKDGKHYRKNIYVEKKENKQRKETVDPKEPPADLIADVDEVCRMVKAKGADGNIVFLPRQTESGIDLKWSSSDSGMAWILPLPIGILTVIYLYKNEEGKKKSEELAAKNEIIRDLPGFTDRLVMLLDAGLIYEDAVNIIIKSYGKRAERGRL
jgi:hypothetical protein